LPAKPAASEKKSVVGKAKGVSAKVWTALAVEVGSRTGVMGLRAAKGASSAIVRFGDGTQETIELARIKLIKWTQKT
jgi:hypothetical protein